MRVLFTVMPALSHLRPALPVARELRSRGWDVAVAASAPMRPAVEREGFGFHPVGPDWEEADAARTFPELATMPLDEQGLWWVSDIFADRAARPAARDLVDVLAEGSVDLVVRDYWDFGAWAAAEAAGVPAAVVGLTMFTAPADMRAFIGPRLQELRASVGLDPDPALASLYAGPYLDLLPPSYQLEVPPDVVRMRPVEVADPPPGPPAWLASPPDRPLVLVTFGTVFNSVPGIFETVVEGLADEPVDVLVTTGRDRELDLADLPRNVRVEPFVAHDRVLPRCAAVVCHAGFGTTMAALAHDLPIVAVPLSADQPVHAARCRELGVATVLDHEAMGAEEVRAAVRGTIADPALRRRAAELGAEIRAMPGPEQAAGVLERYVTRP